MVAELESSKDVLSVRGWGASHQHLTTPHDARAASSSYHVCAAPTSGEERIALASGGPARRSRVGSRPSGSRGLRWVSHCVCAAQAAGATSSGAPAAGRSDCSCSVRWRGGRKVSAALGVGVESFRGSQRRANPCRSCSRNEWIGAALRRQYMSMYYHPTSRDVRHPRSRGERGRTAHRRQTRSSSLPPSSAGSRSMSASPAPLLGSFAPCILDAHSARRSSDPADYGHGGGCEGARKRSSGSVVHHTTRSLP